VHKTYRTYKYKLQPTPTQEQTMAFVPRRCREPYHAAFAVRHEAWRKRAVSVTLASESTQLADSIKVLLTAWQSISLLSRRIAE
jgi:hypothetical protein